MLHLRKRETSNHKILLEVPATKLQQLRRQIRDLGGYYIDSKFFEKSATHLITDTIKCSEKFLGACVRGLWVLSPNYIEDSFEVGLWLDEQEYEYSCNDKNQPADLIAAAKRWRWKVSECQEQPFTGMKVALAMNSYSVFYERLLLYGGAQIFKLPLPLRSEINLPEISFVFMDQSFRKHASSLMEHGLVCLRYIFIMDTIIKDEQLDIFNYMIRDDTNLNDSKDRKLQNFMCEKVTHIMDIGLCDQSNIQEIKVDRHLTMSAQWVALNGLIDKPPQEEQNEFSANDYQGKVDPNNSKRVRNKRRHGHCEYFSDSAQLNESTFQTEDICLPLSETRDDSTVLEQSEINISNLDLNIQHNTSCSDSRVLEQSETAINNMPHNTREHSAPGHKRKLSGADINKRGPSLSKKCYFDKALNNKESEEVVLTSCTTEVGIKPSVGKNCESNTDHQYTGHHFSPAKEEVLNQIFSKSTLDRDATLKQNCNEKLIKTQSTHSNILRDLSASPGRTQNNIVSIFLASNVAKKLISKAKKLRHKRKTVSPSKSLLILQVDVHPCEPAEQTDSKKLSPMKDDKLTRPQKTIRKHYSLDKTESKNATLSREYSKCSGSGGGFEVRSSVDRESNVLSNANKPQNVENTVNSNNEYRSLWTDSIPSMYVESQPQQIKQESTKLSSSVSLSPNIYLYGLNPSTSLSLTNCKKTIPAHQRSASESGNIVKPSKSVMPKNFQTSLDRFGFSPLAKDKGIEEKQDLPVYEDAQSISISRSNQAQGESSQSLTKASDMKQTKRGLAKKKDTDASLSQSVVAVKENVPLFQTGENNTAAIVISDDDSDSDSRTDASHLKVNNPSTKSSSDIILFHEITSDAALGISKQVGRFCDENDSDSSMLVGKYQELLTRSLSNARKFASNPEHIISNRESVSQQKLNVTTQENSKTNRSLFESISDLCNLKDTKINGCSNEAVQLNDTQIDKTACLESVLHADKVSEDINKHNLFQKEGIFDNLPVPTKSSIEDYIDLPTPPTVLLGSDSEDAEEIPCTFSRMSTTVKSNEPCSDDNPSCARKFVNKPKVFKPLSSDPEIELNENVNVMHHSQVLDTPVLYDGWPLTYPIHSNASLYMNKPSLPLIYGQWMESAREMGFHDYAISHARPTSSRAPTSLLLSELVQLVWHGDVNVCPQAITYLYAWLGLHPPVTSFTVNLYIEAFELASENSVLLDIVRSISEESKHMSAVLLLEYFVSMFEVNFDYCLKSRNKKLIQNCLIVKWVWGNSYAVVRGGILRHLLRLLEDVISTVKLDYRACAAASALLNMTCECLRLAGVQWNQCNPKFVMDSVITLSHDLAKRINSFCTPGSDKDKVVVLSMLKPAWLRTLMAAILLSYYNQYLFPDPIHVNKISLSNIVSQFFFLVPQLEPTSEPNSKGKGNLENNCQPQDIPKPLDGMHGSGKNTIQKGTLTANKVNKRNGKGETPIHIACMKNKAAELEKLLAVPGADVNLRDNYGWTPLHEACNHGSYACVELLLKYVPKLPVGSLVEQAQKLCKVEIDVVGPEGLTPFHDAVRNNRLDVCKLMLKYGGQKLLKSKTHSNYTAMDYAQTDEMKEVLISFSESHLDLSISQEPELNTEAVSDTAPLSQRYKELTRDYSLVVSRTNCEEFLMLLMVLLTSYYSVLESIERSGQSDVCLDPKDRNVLANMSTYLKLLKRHVKKLTTREDFEQLLFRLELFELFLIN